MALDKAIKSGKEHRKPYRGSKVIDRTCRNHGGCPWCEENRKHKFRDKHPRKEDSEMAYREKVMTWLEICGKNNDCSGCCPYSENGFGEYGQCRESLMADAYDLLKEQEVKTGHWIDSAGNDKCSICGEEYSDLYPDYGNTHFCPNCGAKMEGR